MTTPAESSSPSVDEGVPSGGEGRRVLKNAAYLGIAEVLSVPLAVLLNGMQGRYLGPEELGYIYVATTIVSLAMLGVNWGQGGTIPAAVVLDRSAAGRILGTSLTWRVLATVVLCAVVTLGCHFFGFTARQQLAIGITFVVLGFTALSAACQETIRGFERTDIAAYARVGQGLLTVAVVIPALLLGGRMGAALTAQAVAVGAVFFLTLRATRPIVASRTQFDRPVLRHILVAGTPFVFFELALVLGPSIDAFYLAKLANAEVVGWYGVSRRLVGFLLVPATALIGALYPTLVRLKGTDPAAFNTMTHRSLESVALLVVPVALGTALFPELGVGIYGNDLFGPANDNLRILAVYIFLVYFSMPLGTALIAGGLQRHWTLIQLGSVALSAVLDPILIRHFQGTSGNGGIGLSIVSVISESVMVGFGIALAPRGVFNRHLFRTLALSVVAGGAMAGVAYVLRSITAFVVAPLAVVAYAGALVVTGAVSKEQLASITGAVKRKLGRRG